MVLDGTERDNEVVPQLEGSIMSIPKIIHYCWFGRNPKPASVLRCIASWKKYCPDYEIREWTEDSFDVNGNQYCREAYEAKKWAFATDYARLWIIYHEGGIYLDTDVELVRPLDPLLEHECFIGRQQGFQVNTGAGFGAVKGHPLVKRMMDDYEDIPFIKENGEMDLWTCPHRNSQWLFENGLRKDDSYQEIAGAAIYPIEFFSPKDVYSRVIHKTHHTYSIHHCDASWNPKESKTEHIRRYWYCKAANCFDWIVHMPNRCLKLTLGEDKYSRFKDFVKGKMKK